MTLLYVFSPITTQLKLMYLKVKKNEESIFLSSVCLLLILIWNPISF